MIKDKKGPNRPYKLIHQLLCIKSINFQRQSLVGLTELTLVPVREFLKIRLNCRQAKIYKIIVNDSIDVNISYHDPTLEVCQDDAKYGKKSVDQFSQAHIAAVSATDPDRGHGEIVVTIPACLTANIAEGRNIKVMVEFAIERPLGGIHFVIPQTDGSLGEIGAHLFTAGYENCSRHWFPCIDAFSEPCTWKLEFTVDAAMTAVACGDLMETVYSSDMKKKTFHYQITTPTCAPKIGLAVGPFEIFVDPNMHEVTHFCLPHLLPLLKETCAFMHETFEFYEELLSFRYPYSCYKQVFVDEAYSSSQSYATLAILDTNLLHSKHIIDQTYETRRILSRSLAEQYFGCFITMNSWADAWLTKGIANFLGYQYYKKAFGNNEYRMCIMKMLDEVIDYEQKFGGFPLDPSGHRHSEDFHFSNRSLQTLSPLYLDAYTKKATLVIRMMEERIGRELLLQVFNKLLTLATVASQQKVTPNNASAWSNMLLSTASYSRAIFVVTGKDIEAFLAQWVNRGGHAKLTGSFVFNRKRNTVELEIKQLDTSATGVRKYMGPLMVWIQELDGSFKHNLQIEENTTKHDITCHSKSRRNKKKKIPLCTGEEVDMDLRGMDPDSPVLWIRVDPDMQLLRQVVLEQPDYQWQSQLRYERDVTAQAHAICQLEKYNTPATRDALTDMIENEHCFYRIRCEATMCLKSVANSMSANWTGPPPMINTFKKLFGSFSCPNIIKLNDFSKFQLYFLQKAMPVAMAGLRTSHGICPQDVVRFLLDLFKYNDNSKNKFSDNYYRASLISALAETVTPAVTAVLARSVQLQSSPAETLSSETKLILEEITRYFNLEKLMPCYKLTVTVSCLKAIRRLQKMGHLPSNPALFKEYAQYNVFVEVRKAAIEALVDVIRAEQRREDLDFLLDLVEGDQIPSVRHAIVYMLIESPPFTKKDTSHPLNTPDLVERIWKLMNLSLSFDNQLRCLLVDLYLTLYGRSRPSCLPKHELSMVFNLKEKIAITHLPDERMEEGGVADSSSKRPVSHANSPDVGEKHFKSGDDVSGSVSEMRPAAGAGAGTEDRHGDCQPSTSSASFLNPQAGTGDAERRDKKRSKEERSHSKPHKEKKKKKKKHKHKSKHKRQHKDQDKERDRPEAAATATSAAVSELEEGEISGDGSAGASDASM